MCYLSPFPPPLSLSLCFDCALVRRSLAAFVAGSEFHSRFLCVFVHAGDLVSELVRMQTEALFSRTLQQARNTNTPPCNQHKQKTDEICSVLLGISSLLGVASEQSPTSKPKQRERERERSSNPSPTNTHSHHNRPSFSGHQINHNKKKPDFVTQLYTILSCRKEGVRKTHRQQFLIHLACWREKTRGESDHELTAEAVEKDGEGVD